MYLKIFGAFLIVFGCGGFGFTVASLHRQQLTSLQQLQHCLDFIQCELQYHQTPLPVLCREASCQCTGQLRRFWRELSQELEDQICPDVHSCMSAVLVRSGLPEKTHILLQDFGRTLGRFDLQGQLLALEGARQACRMEILKTQEDLPLRQRSYQTLSLCAGAALAILLL